MAKSKTLKDYLDAPFEEAIGIEDPADTFVESVLQSPSKDALILARKVDGTLTYFTAEEDEILQTLIPFNIVVNHEDGWLRGVNWREYMRKT